MGFQQEKVQGRGRVGVVCVQLRWSRGCVDELQVLGAPGDALLGKQGCPIPVGLREGSAVTSALPRAPQLGEWLLLEQGLWAVPASCRICCCGISQGGSAEPCPPGGAIPGGKVMAQG